jgi:hypothetical protein
MAVTLARPAALCVPLPKRKKNKTLLAFEIGPSSVCVCGARAPFF